MVENDLFYILDKRWNFSIMLIVGWDFYCLINHSIQDT